MSDIETLLEDAQELPHGPERLAMVEEAVRAADLAQDGPAGYEARKELIASADYAGQSEKMLVAFAWCRSYLDAHPEEFGDWENRDLAWYHKWVLIATHHFPQIPLERIWELHADYARRMQVLGAGAATVPYFRMSLAMHRGDPEDARVAFNLWQFARRDPMSDCAACEAQAIADYHEFLDDDAGCVAQVDKMIARGMTCAHIPHATHGMVLPALLRLGRWDEAERHHRLGRELIAGDPDHLTPQARHLSWAERTSELDDRLDFHLASALLFQELGAGESGTGESGVAIRDTVTLALPQDVPGYRPDGDYPVGERSGHHIRG